MTSTTLSVVDIVREIARERIAPGAAAVDAERAFPRGSIDALAEARALGLMVPAAAGGSGGGLTELVQACEAVGGACAGRHRRARPGRPGRTPANPAPDANANGAGDTFVAALTARPRLRGRRCTAPRASGSSPPTSWSAPRAPASAPPPT